MDNYLVTNMHRTLMTIYMSMLHVLLQCLLLLKSFHVGVYVIQKRLTFLTIVLANFRFKKDEK
jgi:hypothetical protein